MFPPAALTTEAVRYWSDFNRVYYHPRSSVQINEYELNSGIQPFEGYALGQELYRDMNREHEILDRDFRLFAEECDQMQGIQILTSADDAWAGFAGEYLADLRDEFGKVGICTWALERGDRVVRVSTFLSRLNTSFRLPGLPAEAMADLILSWRLLFWILSQYTDMGDTSQDKQITRTITLAMALSKIASQSSIYVPLRYPPATLPAYLNFDKTSEWHTSALLSAAIETSTLPTRMHGGGGFGRMDDLASFLNVNGGQNIAMLSMSISGPDEEKTDMQDDRMRPPKMAAIPKVDRINCSWGQGESKPWRGRKKDHVFAEADVSRGFDEDEEDDSIKSEPTGNGHEPIVSRWVLRSLLSLLSRFGGWYKYRAAERRRFGGPNAGLYTCFLWLLDAHIIYKLN